VNDEGIDEEVQTRLIPETSILGGSALWVTTAVPASMMDYSADSQVVVKDPAGASVIASSALNSTLIAIVSGEGESTNVETLLKDKSGHEKTRVHQLTKKPFFSDAPAVEYLKGLNSNELLFKALAIPGAGREEELLVAFNNRSGGYRLVAGSRVVDSAAQGEIIALEYSGTALFMQIRQNGDEYIKRYPLTGTGLAGVSDTWATTGEFLGVSGETVWLRYGNALSAETMVEQTLVPVLGHTVLEPIHAYQISGNVMYGLSDAGLYQFEIAVEELPFIEQSHFVALPDQDNFLVLGDEIFTWQDELLTHYEMLPDGALANISSSMLPGAIERVISDDELLWVRINHADGPQWLAIENDNIVAVFATSSPEFVAAPGATHFDVMADRNRAVWSRNIKPVSDEIQIAVGIEPLPHVVQFTIDS